VWEFGRKFALRYIEPRFYGALWLLGAALLASLIGLLIHDIKGNKDGIILVASLLGVDLATIGWMWTGRLTADMARRTNALALLQRLSGADVDNWKNKVYPYIAEYRKWLDGHCPDNVRPVMPSDQIERLLGIYEQVAVAINCGAAHEGIIKDAQSLVFRRIYVGLSHQIEHAQKDNKDYFCCFEGITRRWHNDLNKQGLAQIKTDSLFHPLQGTDRR
jgi:Domain of unknown function (DUF4760)